MNLRSLLAITDFSSCGLHALQRAAQLCVQHGAALQIVGLVPAGGEAPRDAFLRLSQHALQLRARHDIEAQAVSAGVLTFEDASRAAASADLVVWGAAERRGVRAWLGTHPVLRMLRTVRRPVIVVRQAADGPYRKLMVAVDFSGTSAAQVDLGLAVQPQSQLELFHAVSTANEGKLRYAEVSDSAIRAYREECRAHARQRMLTLADSYDTRRNRLSTSIGRGDPARQILVHQQHIAADLIVVGRHPASALSDFFFDSVAQRVLRDAPADVMVVPHGLERARGRAAWVPARIGSSRPA